MIRLTEEGAKRIIEHLRTQIARVQDMSVPLAQTGVLLRDSAIRRFKQQGGDVTWIPNKRGGHTGIDTGRLMGSIAIAQTDPNSVTVGTNVRYAKWFQEGTGIYAGRSPWTIVPKNGKALAFTIGGVKYVRRSVTIPGQPARPFLLVSDSDRQKIHRIFQRWFAARDAGTAA